MFFDEFIGNLIPENFSFKTFTKEDITNAFAEKIKGHFNSIQDKNIIVPVIKSKSVGLEFEDQLVFPENKENKKFIKQHSHHVMSKLSLSDKALDNNAIPPKPICFLNEDLIKEKCDHCPFSGMKNFYSITIKSAGKEIINETDVDSMKGSVNNADNNEICRLIKSTKEKSKISFPPPEPPDFKPPIPPEFKNVFWEDDKLIEYLISISFYMYDWTKVVYFPSLFHTINITEKHPQRESGLFYQTNKKDDSNAHCRFLYNQFFMFTNILSLWATHDNILRHSTKAAVASIMGRNMSHNIGSHVLSSLNVKDHPQISVFHSYLQKRMDILARITGEKPSWGEPMYFVGDILNGFFKQSLLLNHLIVDEGGYKENYIEFLVIFPDDKETLFSYDLKEKQWRCDNNGYNDFMVSIPDGEIGVQAFYIFMENMMRNSAKHGYNSKNETQFKITLKIKNDEKEYYKVVAYDNLSTCDGTLTHNIQTKIKENLVDATGSISTTSFGIAEMRESCGFIIYPFEKEYPAHKEGDKTFPLWVECVDKGINNEKNNCADFCKHKHLSYTFNLAKPKMVAIVNNKIEKISESAVKLGIKKVDKEKLLTSEGAYQFACFYINGNEKNEILEFIAKEHNNLPQRLILLDEQIKSDEIIPKKRAVTCKKDDIPLDNLLVSENNDEVCESFIIKVYETWLRSRWLDDKATKLIFNFTRLDTDNVWEKWGISDTKKGIDISKIELLNNKILLELYRSEIVNNVVTVHQVYPSLETSNDSKELLIYDDHGYYTKKYNISNPAFFQYVGGNNKKIFETLVTPPQNIFGFKYFLLGLIEAAFAKVIFVDERVADASFELTDNKSNCHYMQALNEASCYPVFAIGNDDKNEPLTKNLKNKYNKLLSKNECNNSCYLLKWINDAPVLNKTSLSPDFVVLHNGIAETVIKGFKIKNWSKSLYKLVPSIAITSGRGNIIKDDDLKGLPFIEFSAIKDNTFPSISKYHMVRSLMSIKGSINGE